MAAQLQASGHHAGFIGGRRFTARDCRMAVWLLAGLLLGAVVPFTLIVMWPTNKRLEDPGLDTTSELARSLLVRWGICTLSVPGSAP
jgi:hypothetical protein